MIKDKTLDKIKKLLEHAESAEQIGNQAEAAAFMKKVNKLYFLTHQHNQPIAHY